MNTDEALQARQRTEARRFAMASKRVERIADTGMVGNQPVSSEVVRSAVEELEAEIDRLQHRLSNQAATLRVQSETIRRLQDSTSPTEQPMEADVANVPCEPVAVHPAPNVSRVGGE